MKKLNLTEKLKNGTFLSIKINKSLEYFCLKEMNNSMDTLNEAHGQEVTPTVLQYTRL